MQWKAPGEDHHLEALRSDDRARAVVQWKAPGEDHHSSRQIVLSGLSSLSTTISGLINGTQYTIRIAAVDTSDPGTSRPRTATSGMWRRPDSHQPEAL